MIRRRGPGRAVRILRALTPLGVAAAAIGVFLGLAALYLVLVVAGVLQVDAP